MLDHIDMCLSIPLKTVILSVVGYLKSKTAIETAKKFKSRQGRGSSTGSTLAGKYIRHLGRQNEYL